METYQEVLVVSGLTTLEVRRSHVCEADVQFRIPGYPFGFFPLGGSDLTYSYNLRPSVADGKIVYRGQYRCRTQTLQDFVTFKFKILRSIVI